MAKILIVDDSRMSRRVLRSILEDADHTVIEAKDGLTAIEQYYLEHPDLVLLDLTLEDEYGLDVLARLREVAPDARVVIATADIQRQTKELAHEMGIHGYVTKPFQRASVLSAVDSALEERSS